MPASWLWHMTTKLSSGQGMSRDLRGIVDFSLLPPRCQGTEFDALQCRFGHGRAHPVPSVNHLISFRPRCGNFLLRPGQVGQGASGRGDLNRIQALHHAKMLTGKHSRGRVHFPARRLHEIAPCPTIRASHLALLNRNPNDWTDCTGNQENRGRIRPGSPAGNRMVQSAMQFRRPKFGIW